MVVSFNIIRQIIDQNFNRTHFFHSCFCPLSSSCILVFCAGQLVFFLHQFGGLPHVQGGRELSRFWRQLKTATSHVQGGRLFFAVVPFLLPLDVDSLESVG